MVVLAASPCRTQRRHRLLRHRLDIRAESSDRIPPEKEKRRTRQREEAGEVEAAGDREHLCCTSNAGARIPALYPALLGGCALTRDDDC